MNGRMGLTCIHYCMCSVAQLHLTLCDPMNCLPARLLCPWNFSGKDTGTGCHFLLQGIVPAQGSNLSPHWQADSLPLAPPQKPTLLILYIKETINENLVYSTGNSAQCHGAAWMRGEFGGEWIHVYVWLGHSAVHPKLSQHCQLAIIQYKIKSLNKK